MQSGEHKFSHAGTDYRVRMGWAAMRRYENLMDESAVEALQAVEGIEKGAMFGERMVALFHCAIDPRPDDLDVTAEMMDDIGSAEAMALLMKAVDDGFAGMTADDGKETAGAAGAKKKRPRTKTRP